MRRIRAAWRGIRTVKEREEILGIRVITDPACTPERNLAIEYHLPVLREIDLNELEVDSNRLQLFLYGLGDRCGPIVLAQLQSDLAKTLSPRISCRIEQVLRQISVER